MSWSLQLNALSGIGKIDVRKTQVRPLRKMLNWTSTDPKTGGFPLNADPTVEENAGLLLVLKTISEKEMSSRNQTVRKPVLRK